MTADVDLGEKIAIVGYGSHYSGTFDGQGHTLSVNWNSKDHSSIAPFYSMDNVTIKNLHVKGQITNRGNVSGLILRVHETATVSGCTIDMTLKSTEEMAGLIYEIYGAQVTITDCLVKGNFDSSMNNIGGFVYSQGGTCNMANCLYAGTNYATIRKSYTFCEDANLENCYYLNPCGRPQDTQVTKEQLASGYVAKKLQGDRKDACYWAQQLGENPNLYSEADKSKTNYVYYDASNKRWACENFVLTDGQPLIVGIDFIATKATYDRTFTAGKGTFCLPYNLPVHGFNAYRLSDTQGNADAVSFVKVSDKLEAYKPYLIAYNGPLQFVGQNIQVKAFNADALMTTAGKYSFVGTVTGMDNATAVATNAYILQPDGKFHKVTTDNTAATIPAYHAYIVRGDGSGAKQLSVILDGEATGIDGVTNDAMGMKNGPVYDLQGRRVADRLDAAARSLLPAGVYIVGGRKVVVK
ncbi:hypothetical protein JHU38_11760 [Prevotella sp. A2931]|uniref:Uncharacterized protein n=2 Tax=Prevotella illustrans TaxID=2800387 RepID=A0ABS3M8B7_9BACT|nr:hypothetical protein [Prevotella illustrans]